MIRSRARSRLNVAGLVLLLAALALPHGSIVPPAAGEAPVFAFAAAGDLGGDAHAGSSLTTLAGSGTDFTLHLGDLSYNEITPESAWCDFVKSKVGASYPYQLLAGNHEDNGPDGLISNFASCLPDRLGSTSAYGKEYYFDYPATTPLARVIMISPNLAFPGETKYSYANGTPRQAWLANAIDGARASGIRWIVVGMHYNCIAAGGGTCGIGADLLNFLVDQKVDLILQAHTHSYQRSKQLALGSSCRTIALGSFNPSCVIDNGLDGSYRQGAGPVIVIGGMFGQGLSTVDTADPEAGYFATLMGSNLTPRRGFVKYQVSETQIAAQFVGSTSGTFSDSFTINVNGGGGGNNPPTATNVSASTTQASPTTLALAGTDTEACELTFSIVDPQANGTLSAPSDEPCTAGAPNTDRATVTYTPNASFSGNDFFTYDVSDGTASSNIATATITVSPAGTSTLLPIDDATLKQGSPGANFGGASTLQADNSPVEHFLLKFDTRGVAGSYSSAKLRLFNFDASSNGGQFSQCDSTWEEESVSWSSAPAAGAQVASLGRVSGSSTSPVAYEVELKDYITGPGIWSLRVATSSTNGADYYSKERGGGFEPVLIVSSSG